MEQADLSVEKQALPNDAIILNDYYGDVPVSFTVLAIRPQKGGRVALTNTTAASVKGVEYSEIVDLTTLMYNTIKKIEITDSINDIPKSELIFEYGVNHDSYIINNTTKKRQVPPWSIFFSVTNSVISYAIRYKFLKTNKIYLAVADYDLSARQAELKKIVSSNEEGEGKGLKERIEAVKRKAGTAPTQGQAPNTISVGNKKIGLSQQLKTELNAAIRDFVLKVQKSNETLEKSFKNRKYINIEDSGLLITGSPVVNSLKGNEQGIFEFNVVMHNKLTLDDQELQKVQDRYIFNVAITTYKFVNRNCYMNFLNDAAAAKPLTVADFMALLLGGNLDNNLNFTPGVYVPKSTSKIHKTFTDLVGTPPIQTANNVAEATSSKALYDVIYKNYIFNFAELNNYKFLDDYFLQKESTSVSNKLAMFDSATYGRMLREIDSMRKDTKLDNFTNVTSSSGQATGNLEGTFFAAAMPLYEKLLTLSNTITKTNIDGFFEYAQIIQQVFGIKMAYGGFNGLVQELHFYKNQVPVVNNSVVNPAKEQVKTIQQKVLLMDYGGLVVNFQHIVKASPIKFDKNVTGSGNDAKRLASLTIEGVTLQMELNESHIKEFGDIVYNEVKAEGGTLLERSEKYYDIIQTAIQNNPDDFLARFVDFAVANGGKFRDVDPTIAMANKGGQHLTLNLRHPAPGVAVGSIIYFLGAGEDVLTDNGKSIYNIGDSLDAGNNGYISGFYVIPPKIRGIYFVTKIHSVFNAESNIWTHRVECER
jgi:hypothetical protein